MSGKRFFTFYYLVIFVLIEFLKFPTEVRAKGVRFGLGASSSIGAWIPKGNLWSVDTRASIGFPIHAGLRIIYSHTCTMPSVFFIPAFVDTEDEGINNGRYLAVLGGMQVYPYNVYILQPYFMFGAGASFISYSGPSTRWVTAPEQSGKSKGIAVIAGGGLDIAFHKWFSAGPSFFWNPVWWHDCKRETELVENDPCNPSEDSWILKFWFAGLRVSVNFPE